MYTVNQAFEREKVEDYFANAFKKYIGKTALPHTYVTTINFSGYHDTVTKRTPTGHGEYWEDVRDIIVINAFILFTVVENTHVVNHSGIYEFHFYATDDDQDREDAAYDAMLSGTRELSVTPRYVEGEFEDGA